MLHSLSALELGGPDAGVYFIPHGGYAAQAQRLLGKEVVDKYYPMDNTHSAPLLADVVSGIVRKECAFRRFANNETA